MTERKDGPAGGETCATDLLALITVSWKSQAVYVAAELGIADVLSHEAKSSEDVAAAIKADADAVARLLRALCTIDICRQMEDGRFEMTVTGELLRADHPGSLRSWAIWWGEHLWPVWGKLAYSVRTGRSARALLTGTEGFKHLEADPAAAEVFNRALAELTRMSTASILGAYDFSRFKRFIDVGGGQGELLAAILEANPGTSGVIFDLPHAIDGARGHFERCGLAGRCEFVAGDFFETIPAGGDAYMMKSVIHDWNDERAAAILRRCNAAMRERHGARLLLIEQVMPDRAEPLAVHQSLSRSDLTMLVAHAARERSQSEFAKLLEKAGFEIVRMVPAGPTFSVIEAAAR